LVDESAHPGEDVVVSGVERTADDQGSWVEHLDHGGEHFTQYARGIAQGPERVRVAGADALAEGLDAGIELRGRGVRDAEPAHDRGERRDGLQASDLAAVAGHVVVARGADM